MKPRPAKRRLRLEPLEIRALLAGDVGSDLFQATAAVQGSAPIDAAFNPTSGNNLLELSGHGTEAVFIDLDRLPSFVTKLSLSHFSSVTMSGTDHVEFLIASDIGSLVAPNLSVTGGVFLENVATVELASAGPLAFLSGEKTDFSVRSLEQTTIHSGLQSLTIASETAALSIENSNPNPRIEVKYHPELVSVAGIDSLSVVHIVDPGTPSTGIPSSDLSSGGTGGSESNLPVVVIVDTINQETKTVDERMLAFIAEFNKSVRASSKDSQHLLSEFLNLWAPEAGQPSLPGNTDARRTFQANPHDLEAALQGTQIITDAGEISATTDTRPGDVAPASIALLDQFTDRPLDLSPAPAQTAVEARHTVEIDATWPVAVAPVQPTENAHLFTPLGLTQPQPTELKLEETLRAFTDYVADRVAAEFSPGQQSLVLLVDPKPSRPGTANQNSALDLFGSKTRTSIASLRQVMS